MKISVLSILMLFLQVASAQTNNNLNSSEEKQQISSQNTKKQHVLKKIQIGEGYESSGFYANALQYYNQILETYKGISKDSLYVIVTNKAGTIYNNTYEYKSAAAFFNEAFKTSKTLNYKAGMANSLSLLGENYGEQGEYLKALELENKSLGFLNVKKNRFEVAKVYENIGSIYEDLLQFDKASDYFNKSYALVKDSKTKQEVNVLNNIGDVYRKTQNISEGLKITTKALDLATRLKDNRLMESANKDLAKAYALKEDYKKAYNYRIEAEKFKDQALKNENKNLIHQLLADFEMDRKESQIQLLEVQNKSSKTLIILLLVLSVSLVIIASLAFLFVRKKRIAKAEIQKYEQQRLEAELEKKWDEEKNLLKNLELKTAALSNYSLHIAQKNKMLSDLSFKLKNMMNRKQINYENQIKELYSEIDFTLQQENEWEDFTIFFEEIHPNYIQNLSRIAFEDLTQTELKLGILLRLNLSSKEIASILRITPDSVRVARHRFRKKLPIDSKKDLVSFLLEF